MNDLIVKILGVPQGSPGIKESLDIWKNEKIRKKQNDIASDYNINRINTKYGSTDSAGTLNEYFKRAMAEREAEMNPVYGPPKPEGLAPLQPQTLQEQYIPPAPEYVPPVEQPQVLGSQVPSRIPVYTEEQKNKAIDYFAKMATYLDANSQYRRTPEDAKKNSEYVRQYLEEVFRQAPQHGLDPMMITAIAGQESGWGGTRHGHNLLGSGVFEDGTNLGRGQGEDTMAAAVGSLLKSISEDWGGIYQNKTTPEGFVEGEHKWNVHPSWVQKVGIIRNNLN